METIDIDYESELSQFQMECLRARAAARATCREYKLLYDKGKELFTMTPQEELHAKFFNHKVELIKDMDLLALRAHREELAMIAFKARAEVGAADEVIKQKEKKDKKSPGFTRSVLMDDASSNAINNIQERQKKLSKDEKMIENMRKMGISEEYIQNTIMSNMKIHKQIQKENIAEAKNKSIEAKASETKPQALINPFAPKKTGE